MRSNRTETLTVLLLVLIGIAIRLDFLLAPNFVIDADESIVGLMAKHMMEGRGVPTFYYGQHYMGSLEAIVTSIYFYLFGISAITLQLAPFTFGIALIPLVYLLGRELGGRRIATIAALFVALPPVSLVVWSLKARGGFIELVWLGTLALLLAVRWFKKSPPDRTLLIWCWIALGFAWWVNNQAIYFILPIAIFMGLRILRCKKDEGIQGSIFILLSDLILVSIVSFFVGGAPFWIYNIEKGFPSFGMFGTSTPSDILDHFNGLFSTALPILLGAKQFWQNAPLFFGATAIYYAVYAILIAVVLSCRKRAFFDLFRLKIQRSEPVELLFLIVAASCAIFVVSSFGWLVQAPRYLLPLYPVLFLILAIAIDMLWRKKSSAGYLGVSLVLSFNLLSCYLGGRAIPGEPVVFAGERVAKDQGELIRWLDDHKFKWVRTNYWIGYRLAFETNERIRFLVTQEPFTVRIKSYEEEGRHLEINSMPLVLVPSQAQIVSNAFVALGYQFKKTSVSGYVVLYDVSTPNRSLKPLPSKGIKVSANRSSEKAVAAIDGDRESRWGTAESQRPGEEFDVEFNPSQPIAGIEYVLGHWASDYPRGLSVRVEYDSGEFEEIINPGQYTAIRYYTEWADELSIFLSGKPIKKIILTQTGRDKVFDWSIAELSFFVKGDS